MGGANSLGSVKKKLASFQVFSHTFGVDRLFSDWNQHVFYFRFHRLQYRTFSWRLRGYWGGVDGLFSVRNLFRK